MAVQTIHYINDQWQGAYKKSKTINVPGGKIRVIQQFIQIETQFKMKIEIIVPNTSDGDRLVTTLKVSGPMELAFPVLVSNPQVTKDNYYRW